MLITAVSGSEGANLMLESYDMKPQRTDLRPEKADFGLRRLV